MGRRRRGGRLAKSITELIEEFKKKYPGFLANSGFIITTDWTGRDWESDPKADLFHFGDLIRQYGYRGRQKSFFMSWDTLMFIQSKGFFSWVQPTDWEIYEQSNENLRRWRKRLFMKMRKQALNRQRNQNQKQWRADERRRSRQKRPGR